MPRKVLIAFCLLLCSVFCLGASRPDSWYLEEISDAMVVSGVRCRLDTPLLLGKDGVLIPVRVASRALGIEDSKILWNGTSQVVTVKTPDGLSTIKVGERTVTQNGEKMSLEAAVMLYRGRVYAPLSFFRLALHAEGKEDAEYHVVYLKDATRYAIIKQTLDAMVVVNPNQERRASCSYYLSDRLAEKTSGEWLTRSIREGKASYSFQTGECLDRGTYTDGLFQTAYSYRYINGQYTYRENDRMPQNGSAEAGETFLAYVLGMLRLTRNAQNELAPLPPLTVPYQSMNDNERYAFLLDYSDAEELRTISGSLLGLFPNRTISDITFILEAGSNQLREKQILTRIEDEHVYREDQMTYQYFIS